MRYRRVKGATEKIERLKEYFVSCPEEYRGKWEQVFGNDHPIFLEMGCGKGRFLTELARQHPEYNYIGVEGQERVFLRAAQMAHEAELSNIVFIGQFLQRPSECFAEGEIAGLYLNFSDPWPKARHAKRRLTHRRYLAEYRRFLKEGAAVEFKTDGDGLFDFSLEEFRESGWRILELTRDLHATDLPAKEITSDYEEKFKGWGKNINYLKARLETGDWRGEDLSDLPSNNS